MTIRTIVVGVEGSANAEAAVVLAAEVARGRGARVVAVHAFEPLALLGKVEPPVDFAVLEETTRRTLRDEWCAPLHDAGVVYEARVVENDPVHGLVEAADEVEADLIVVGARGMSRLKGLVLGSTSIKLPQVAGRPVTIVPHPDHRR